MRTMKLFLRPLAIALLLTTLGSQSFAQFNGSSGGGGRRSRNGDTGNASKNNAGLSGPQSRSGQLNEKLGDLRLQLLITPEQSDRWLDFYDRVFELLDRSGGNRVSLDGQTAPQALQQRLVDTQGRMASLQRVTDAVTKLYAVLTPDQQHIADQYLPPIIP